MIPPSPTPPDDLPPLPDPPRLPVSPGLPDLVGAFRVLGDPTRLRIVKLLSAEEYCVCELVHLLGLSQPAVSQHLAKLRAAGLVSERRAGQWVVYRLDRARLEAALAGFRGFLEAPLDRAPGLEAAAARRPSLDRVEACRLNPISVEE